MLPQPSLELELIFQAETIEILSTENSISFKDNFRVRTLRLSAHWLDLMYRDWSYCNNNEMNRAQMSKIHVRSIDFYNSPVYLHLPTPRHGFSVLRSTSEALSRPPAHWRIGSSRVAYQVALQGAFHGQGFLKPLGINRFRRLVSHREVTWRLLIWSCNQKYEGIQTISPDTG